MVGDIKLIIKCLKAIFLCLYNAEVQPRFGLVDHRSCSGIKWGPGFIFSLEKAFPAPFVIEEILGAQHHGNPWILAQHEQI